MIKKNYDKWPFLPSNLWITLISKEKYYKKEGWIMILENL